MATGIFPEDVAGGLVIRDAAGAPVVQPEVHNAYRPAPSFYSTCLLTALPTNCDARIEARQVNAIVSELVSFAECLNPSGTWNCDSLKNLCASFSAWMEIHISGVLVGDTPPVYPANNQLWWESDTGFLFLYYNDGNSNQWVQITSKVVVDNVSIVGAGLAGDPIKASLIDCGEY